MKTTIKEIRQTVEKGIRSALEKLKVSSPSKKTEKVITKASKAVSRRAKIDIKKLAKKSLPMERQPKSKQSKTTEIKKQ